MIERITDICLSMETVWPTMWDSCWVTTWPNGACTVTSLLLAPLLRASIHADLHVVIGVVDGMKHCWIELDDGTVVDPTFGQFVPGLQPLMILPPAECTSRGHRAHTVLSLEDEENYRSTIRPMASPFGTHACSAIKADFWDLPATAVTEITTA